MLRLSISARIDAQSKEVKRKTMLTACLGNVERDLDKGAYAAYQSFLIRAIVYANIAVLFMREKRKKMSESDPAFHLAKIIRQKRFQAPLKLIVGDLTKMRH